MTKGLVQDNNELPFVLTIKDVQQVMGLSRDMAYRLPHRKGFPVIRFGRALRVPRDAFLRWLDEQTKTQEE